MKLIEKTKIKMTEHGAALQTYNQELVKFLESVKTKREEVLDIMNKEEAECAVLQKNLKNMTEKLNALTQSLQRHRDICSNYDKLITETENGFMKILESSQTLLQVAQQEINRLDSDFSNPSEKERRKVKIKSIPNPKYSSYE